MTRRPCATVREGRKCGVWGAIPNPLRTFTKPYQGERRGAGGQWVERDERSFRVAEAMPNAWLWLDGEAMRAQCEAVGVDAERALAAELVAYDDKRLWEYDRGFGIARRSPTENEETIYD